MQEPIVLESVQWSTYYTAAPGYFSGSGATVDCVPLIAGLSAFNDRDGESRLVSGVLSTASFTAPIEVARCAFLASALPVASNFSIVVEEAYDVHGPLLILPHVTVSSVVCEGAPTACGDGVVESFEECDDGNSLNSDACTTSCRHARCGDGYVWSGKELCDDGNPSSADNCPATCKPAACGDGHVYVGFESCDDGNTVDSDSCLSTCTPAACGDGHVLIGVEQCDDANALDSDACTNNCKAARCGDGFVRAGVESCDDGNSLNTDACTNFCKVASCGDGYVRTGVEICDDGNAIGTDSCPPTCKPAVCGDGFVRDGTEQCDDGGAVSGDGCDANCTVTGCGNGILTSGEVCDDGNKSNSDACPASCKPAVCGDGYRWSGFEECDDGNVTHGDGCSAVCEEQQRCGDATDDGNIYASDALRVLQSGVGIDVECPTWICDVDSSNSIGASDALRILRRSVDLPVAMACGQPSSIVVRITSKTVLGALQLSIGYHNVFGEILGSGSDVACSPLQPDVQAAFNNKPERILAMSFASLRGIQGPQSVARCGFAPTANVDPEDFSVFVLDAKDKDGNSTLKPGIRVVPY